MLPKGYSNDTILNRTMGVLSIFRYNSVAGKHLNVSPKCQTIPLIEQIYGQPMTVVAFQEYG